MELAGGKVKHLGVFMEVLRYRQRFLEVDRSSVDIYVYLHLEEGDSAVEGKYLYNQMQYRKEC